MAVVIDANSFALHPFRIDIKNNQFVNYEAFIFPKHPKAGCDMYLRRVAALFGLAERGPKRRGCRQHRSIALD